MIKFKEILIQILDVLAGAAFLVMVVLTVYQVVTRYVLNAPSSWSEELVSYMFAWMTLLGASLCTAHREHMNIPILVDHVKTTGKKWLNVLSEVIQFLFSMLVLVFGGWQIANLALGQQTSSLGVPIGIFYYVMVLVGVLNMIFTCINIILIFKGEISLEEPNTEVE